VRLFFWRNSEVDSVETSAGLGRRERRLLIAVTHVLLSLVTLAVAFVLLFQLRQTHLMEERAKLTNLVNSWAALIGSVGEFDRTYSATDHPGGSRGATLSQVSRAWLNLGMIQHGGAVEIVEQRGDSFTVLLPRPSGSSNGKIFPLSGEFIEANLVRAHATTHIVRGSDYRGVEVMAALRFLPDLGWGIVAKMDMADINKPILHAATITISVAIGLILLGSMVILTAVKPVWSKLDERTAELVQTNIQLQASTSRRKKIARQLRKSHRQLEERVRRRTAEIQEKNTELTMLEGVISQSETVVFLIRVGETLKIEYISPNAVRMGLDEDSSKDAESIMETVVHPDDRRAASEALARLVRNETDEVTFEFRGIGGANGQRWYENRAALEKDESGRPVFIRGTVTDMTDLKAALERELQSEAKFRALVENAGEAIVISVDGRIIFCNDQLVRITGHEREKLLSHPFTEFIHPDDRQMVLDYHMKRLRGEPVPRLFEFRVVDSDGTDRWVDNNGVLITWEGRSAALSFLTDVTERHLQEDYRRMLSTAIEASADSIVVMDRDGRIEYVNAAYERLSGYGLSEIKGRVASYLSKEEKTVRLHDEIWETVRGGDVWTGRFHNVRSDGSTLIEDATVSPVFDDAEEVIRFVAVKHDVTEEIQLQQQLHQSQKLEALGLLAGGIAHDFNNMLTAIVGYGTVLQQGLPEDDPRLNDVKEILATANRAASLTRQLLAYGRKQIIQPVVVNINEVVSDMISMLKRVVGEQYHISTELSDKPLRAYIDVGQLEVALLNLVVNARDAMAEGGRVQISTDEEPLDAATAASCDLPADKTVIVLRCSDSGCGMDEATKAKIFDPFFTTKELGKGTGLGLATVYGITKQAGGHIRVDSRPGAGTTFELLLPVAGKVEQTGTADPPDGQAEGPGRSATILIVEDDEAIRRIARKILGAAGYTVLAAKDAIDARVIVDTYGETIDLLVSDIVLPDVNGIELAAEVRSAIPDLKLLFMSGYASNDLLKEVEHESFLAKPFSPGALEQAVADVLNCHHNHGSSV